MYRYICWNRWMHCMFYMRYAAFLLCPVVVVSWFVLEVLLLQRLRFSWSSLRSLVGLGLWCSFRCLDCNMQMMNVSPQILKFKSYNIWMKSAFFFEFANGMFQQTQLSNILYASISIPIRNTFLSPNDDYCNLFLACLTTLSPCSILCWGHAAMLYTWLAQSEPRGYSEFQERGHELLSQLGKMDTTEVCCQ